MIKDLGELAVRDHQPKSPSRADTPADTATFSAAVYASSFELTEESDLVPVLSAMTSLAAIKPTFISMSSQPVV